MVNDFSVDAVYKLLNNWSSSMMPGPTWYEYSYSMCLSMIPDPSWYDYFYSMLTPNSILNTIIAVVATVVVYYVLSLVYNFIKAIINVVLGIKNMIVFIFKAIKGLFYFIFGRKKNPNSKNRNDSKDKNENNAKKPIPAQGKESEVFQDCRQQQQQLLQLQQHQLATTTTPHPSIPQQKQLYATLSPSSNGSSVQYLGVVASAPHQYTAVGTSFVIPPLGQQLHSHQQQQQQSTSISTPSVPPVNNYDYDSEDSEGDIDGDWNEEEYNQRILNNDVTSKPVAVVGTRNMKVNMSKAGALRAAARVDAASSSTKKRSRTTEVDAAPIASSSSRPSKKSKKAERAEMRARVQAWAKTAKK
jgi:hypothetical protein